MAKPIQNCKELASNYNKFLKSEKKNYPVNLYFKKRKKKSLLFNMVSRLVIAFLPRSKHLLIAWLKTPTSLILEPKKIKAVNASIVSPCIYHEVMRQDAMIFIYAVEF